MIEHKIIIYLNNEEMEVNVETVNLDERLDEVLDSAKLNFISEKIKTDIPPFTPAVIYPGEEYFYCNSVCDEIVEMPGYYYHTCQLVEAVKITETWVIGTKSFSVIKGKENYNTGFDKIKILNEIVKQQYGYTIELDYFLQFKLTSEQSLSYGAGTTYFDIVLDIFKKDNCLPIISKIYPNEQKLKLSYIDFNNLKTEDINEFKVYSKVTKNQNVDEYCNSIVTEMNSVVDRDTISTSIMSARSVGETITKDTALLKLPTKCESVKTLYCRMKGKTGPTVKIPASELNLTGSTYNSDVKTLSVKLYQWIDAYANERLNYLLKQWISKMESELEKGSGYYDEGYIYYEKDNYCLITIWNSSDYELEDGWVNLGVLNEKQWSLLTTDEQPYFIYYENDSNIITGFMNYKDNDFWDSAIFGEKGPFFKEIYKSSTEDGYRRQMLYTNFDENSIMISNGSTEVRYKTDYHILAAKSGSTNILDYIFKVEYVAKSCIEAKSFKTLQPENESSWKNTVRSYNNGASTVDFNQLIPAMDRSVNMLGLETTTIESLEDKPIGTRTQFGYIISKQSNYNIYDYNKVINYIFYNCCQNYQQIAAAIGIDTQWEATNVASNDIVTRYVAIERKIDVGSWKTIMDYFLDEESAPFIAIKNPDGTWLSKNAARMIIDDTLYLSCEAEDNFTFDYSKEKSSVSNYYKNNPVAYADKDQCRERYELFTGVDNKDAYRALEDYETLPRGYIGTLVFGYNDIYVAKDARERLVFEYRIRKK